ncbi:hypothetical protein AK830_g2819 [Neonectria ditissima]|uniref:non-specific serine/threonine protein kinase n=1 Tax=Neonectria ditissima TaxID=78410 RepID=A0A0P7BTT8_9HYPO|nr:hypothetical protein AK830_g2819 [Neonectria ditissima]
MSTSAFKYHYIEDVEDIEDYKTHGYHPIHIDDRLQDRYRIVHKFGHGTFSTAWLAHDEWAASYVAVKVGTADAETKELDILSQLTHETAHAKTMIPVVLDRFEINGPNGTHPCLVTVPARCSLRASKEASKFRMFQLEVARALATQLLLAISFIHSQGYAHGDLHLGNLLLRMDSSLDKLSVEELYAKLGAPERVSVERVNGAPSSSAPGVPMYAVPPVWLGIASDKLPLGEARLLLSDFGVAFRPEDKDRFESYTPLIYRPPEAFFQPKTPLTLASDIWSLGCVVFELFAHRSLIDGVIAPQDDITAQQVHLQGRMPDEWWESWEERPKWFDDAGNALSPEGDVFSWEKRFAEWVQETRQEFNTGVIPQAEFQALLALLKRMLAWKPEDRPTIAQVLDSDWARKWGLPAYQASLNQGSK